MKERRKEDFPPRRLGMGCSKEDAALRRLPADGIFQCFARKGGRNQGVLRADARAGAASGALRCGEEEASLFDDERLFWAHVDAGRAGR